jgi:PhoPQ-activated pathogenicity-related protein
MLKHVIVSLLLSFSISPFAHLAAAEPTALDAYVAEPDPNYSYTYRDTRHGVGYSVHVLDMVSQEWRTLAEVDRLIWEHELLIAVPWVLHSGNDDTAILIVNGGGNDTSGSANSDELMGVVANVTGSVVAMISQVPNQPLRFADEAEAREEDALLAYGMDKYLKTGDPQWLVHFPMTKAVVRALDTVQDFADEGLSVWPEPPRIGEFILVGGSKRGWATYLAAAVEAGQGGASRVKAIVPASIDLLNLDDQFLHHWNAYGFYAPAVQDYADLKLPCRAATPAGQEMLQLIDPYAYRERLTMPKLVLNSAGDQFFLPDSSQFYFGDLPGPTRLRYTLNTDHSQAQDLPSVILPTLSWLSDVLDDKASPNVEWSLEPDGAIWVRTDTEPKRVRLWQATNPHARDFRLESIGEAWTSTELAPSADGEYRGYVAPPPQGWTAFTVELTFPGSTVVPTPLESDQIFTTDVRVLPDVYPGVALDCGEPTAVLRGAPVFAGPGVSFIASAADSSDPDGEIVRFDWTVLGNCTILGPRNNVDVEVEVDVDAPIQFPAEPCTIALNVTDDYGFSDGAAFDVTVLPADSVDAMQQVYIAYLGRPADVIGLHYWGVRLLQENGNLGGLIAAFGTSSEYTNRYGSLDDEALIDTLYRNLFGRAADADGREWYIAERLIPYRHEWTQVHDGNPTGATEYALSRIALDILFGAQGDDRKIIKNKLVVASYFTREVTVRGVNYDAEDIPLAVSMLGEVGLDEASVEAAKERIDSALGEIRGPR